MYEYSVLEEAKDAITKDRARDYGDAISSMNKLAALWSAYLGDDIHITGSDAAVMLSLLKISRIRLGNKSDNWVDLVGYAAIGSECAHEEWESETAGMDIWGNTINPPSSLED